MGEASSKPRRRISIRARGLRQLRVTIGLARTVGKHRRSFGSMLVMLRPTNVAQKSSEGSHGQLARKSAKPSLLVGSFADLLLHAADHVLAISSSARMQVNVALGQK